MPGAVKLLGPTKLWLATWRVQTLGQLPKTLPAHVRPSDLEAPGYLTQHAAQCRRSKEPGESRPFQVMRPKKDMEALSLTRLWTHKSLLV